MTAYLKSFQPDVSYETMTMVYPFLGIATNASMSFGTRIADSIGYKTVCFACGLLISLTFVIDSLLTIPSWFIVVFCLMFGVPNGVAYMIPISN